MNRKFRLFLALAATAATVVGGLTVGASPAMAGTSCSAEQHKSVPTPGYDTDFEVQVCVTNSGTRRTAYVIVGWTDGGDSSADGNRKFDALRVHYRLERYDADYASGSCSIAGLVNTNSSGSYSCPDAVYTSSLTGGWTGDGYLEYDLDRDGKGASTWQFTGSPQVS